MEAGGPFDIAADLASITIPVIRIFEVHVGRPESNLNFEHRGARGQCGGFDILGKCRNAEVETGILDIEPLTPHA